MCAHAYLEREAARSRRGPGPAAVGGFDALSYYLSLILSIMIHSGDSQDLHFRGGGKK